MRATEILVEQQPRKGVSTCDHAGLAINKFFHNKPKWPGFQGYLIHTKNAHPSRTFPVDLLFTLQTGIRFLIAPVPFFAFVLLAKKYPEGDGDEDGDEKEILPGPETQRRRRRENEKMLGSLRFRCPQHSQTAPSSVQKTADKGPLGPLGFDLDQHSPTTRPSVKRTAENEFLLLNRV